MILLLLLYAAGMLVTTVLATRYLAVDMGNAEPDGEDWILGFLVSILWPLVWLGLAILWPARKLYRFLFDERDK